MFTTIGTEAREPEQRIITPMTPSPFERLETWDFSFVRKVLMREEGIDEAEAKRRERKYLAFMEGILRGKKGVIGKEDRDTDSYWHCHLVCTHDYARFCNEVMGRFIHHVPNIDTGSEVCTSQGCASGDPSQCFHCSSES